MMLYDDVAGIISEAKKKLGDDYDKYHQDIENLCNLASATNKISDINKLLVLVDKTLLSHMLSRDGSDRICELIPEYSEKMSATDLKISESLWGMIGFYYRLQTKYHDAINIYNTHYNYLCKRSLSTEEEWFAKSTPLVWMYDCFNLIGFRSIAKRFIMLTLIEDAIAHEGIIKPTSGVYPRLVKPIEFSESLVNKFGEQAYKCFCECDNDLKYFPEWILQNIDNDWLDEIPNNNEYRVYIQNGEYLKYIMGLIDDLKKTKSKRKINLRGDLLEYVAQYLLMCMPGNRVDRKVKTKSSEIDVLCSVEGYEVDFRSELGRYIICECKELEKKANIDVMAKFCYFLVATKCKLGILFTREGVSGDDLEVEKWAKREQLKFYQSSGVVVLEIKEDDIRKVIDGKSFYEILMKKYEIARLDLEDKPQAKKKKKLLVNRAFK